MESQPYFNRSRLISILTCLAAIGVCGLAMAIMPSDRERHAQLFADFHLKLPALTKAVIDTPDVLVLSVLGGFAIASVVAVGLFRSSHRAIMLHLGVMAITGIAMAAWEKALALAYSNLLEGMVGGSR